MMDISPHLKTLIESFTESLATEKGYSENTCRAYSHDLVVFSSFIVGSRGAGNTFRVDEVDGLIIREYLGLLHQKNKKKTLARKLSAIRSFFKFVRSN